MNDNEINNYFKAYWRDRDGRGVYGIRDGDRIILANGFAMVWVWPNAKFLQSREVETMSDHDEAHAVAEEQIANYVLTLQKELAHFGDADAQGTSPDDFRDGFIGNHGLWLVGNAAAGVVECIVELRTKVGLPIIR